MLNKTMFMTSLLDLDTLEPRTDEIVEVHYTWKQLYDSEIKPRLNNKGNNHGFTHNIVGVTISSTFGTSYHSKEDIAKTIHGIVENSIVVDDADCSSYNTIGSTLKRIGMAAPEVVIVDNFDAVPNKNRRSTADTFLLDGLEELWKNGTIKVVVLVFYTIDGSLSLPEKYQNIALYGDICKVLP